MLWKHFSQWWQSREYRRRSEMILWVTLRHRAQRTSWISGNLLFVMSSAVLSALWRAVRLWSVEQPSYHTVIHPVKLELMLEVNLKFLSFHWSLRITWCIRWTRWCDHRRARRSQTSVCTALTNTLLLSLAVEEQSCVLNLILILLNHFLILVGVSPVLKRWYNQCNRYTHLELVSCCRVHSRNLAHDC